jgi:hypothetical protein
MVSYKLQSGGCKQIFFIGKISPNNNGTKRSVKLVKDFLGMKI